MSHPAQVRKALSWLADRQILFVMALAPIFMLADRWHETVVVAGVLVVPAIWTLHKVGRGCFFMPTPADLPLLLLYSTLPIGFWVSALPERSLPVLLQYLFALTLFYALVNTLSTQTRMVWAGLAFQAATAVMVGLALAGTAWGGAKILHVDLARHIPYLLRTIWYSSGFHPNIVGGVLALLLPTTVAYAWAARTWLHRSLWTILLLVGTVTLVMTQSRGALVAYAAALLAVTMCRSRRWLWLAVALLVVVLAGISWVGFEQAMDLVMDNIGAGTLQSGEVRLEILSRGLYMVEDFAFTGIGLGMFPETLSLLYPLFQLGPAPSVPHVHNLLLQVAIDHGIPGLAAFTAFLIVIWTMANRSRKLARGSRLEPLATGLLAGLVAYFVHGLVDWVWHTPRSHPIVWAYFGLIAALWRALSVESNSIRVSGIEAEREEATDPRAV